MVAAFRRNTRPESLGIRSKVAETRLISAQRPFFRLFRHILLGHLSEGSPFFDSPQFEAASDEISSDSLECLFRQPPIRPDGLPDNLALI